MFYVGLVQEIYVFKLHLLCRNHPCAKHLFLQANCFTTTATLSTRNIFTPEIFYNRNLFFAHHLHLCTFLLQIPFTPNRFLFPKPWQHEKRFTPKPLTPCFTKILLLYTITFTYHIVRQKSVHRPSHTPNSHTASYRLVRTRIRSPNRNHFNATRKLLHQKPLQQKVSFTKNLYIFEFPHLSKLLRRKHFTQRTLHTRKLCTAETVPPTNTFFTNKHLLLVHQSSSYTRSLTPNSFHQKPFLPRTCSQEQLFAPGIFYTRNLVITETFWTFLDQITFWH